MFYLSNYLFCIDGVQAGLRPTASLPPQCTFQTLEPDTLPSPSPKKKPKRVGRSGPLQERQAVVLETQLRAADAQTAAATAQLQSANAQIAASSAIEKAMKDFSKFLETQTLPPPLSSNEPSFTVL